MLRNIIENNKVRWYDVDKLDAIDAEIQKIINQLDGIAVQYECKWGIGILQQKCSPDLLEKWMRQCEKFEVAMCNRDVNLIRDLVNGFIRAYEMLENDLLTNNINPKDATFMAYQINGKEIIVCRDNEDARIMAAKRKGNYTHQIFTMSEIASIIDKDHDLLKNIESSLASQPEKKELDPFDFSVGDEINL